MDTITLTPVLAETFTNQERIEFIKSLPTTFNHCNVCGEPIDKDDYCYADSIHGAKTGRAFLGTEERLVFRQHHLKCTGKKTLW